MSIPLSVRALVVVLGLAVFLGGHFVIQALLSFFDPSLSTFIAICGFIFVACWSWSATGK